MPYNCVQHKENDRANSHWVQAASEEEARRHVSLNIPNASEAGNPSIFDCVLNDEKNRGA